MDKESSSAANKSSWDYWLIRNEQDVAIEVVRARPSYHVVIAGEGKGKTQHKRSSYFTHEHKPDLNKPVSFQLIHAGDASSPRVEVAIAEVEANLYARARRVKRRKQYDIADARAKALALLETGSSVREVARLCGVPKSTVSDWRALIAVQ